MIEAFFRLVNVRPNPANAALGPTANMTTLFLGDIRLNLCTLYCTLPAKAISLQLIDSKLVTLSRVVPRCDISGSGDHFQIQLTNTSHLLSVVYWYATCASHPLATSIGYATDE
jgi:hypothetical protein